MGSVGPAPLSVEPTDLLPPLRRMFGSDDVTVADCECRTPRGAVGTTDASVLRVSGVATVQGQPRPWALIRKALVAPSSGRSDYGSSSEAPSALSYWKREFHLYRSGLLDRLPPGLAAPRCYHTEVQPDRCVIWLEEIREELPVWPLERYGVAAYHLGLFNGLSLTARSVPDYPWLTVEIQRQRERSNRGFFARMDELRQHEIVRRGWPDDVAEGMLRIWQERERFYGALRALPHVLQHGDAGHKNLFSRTGADGEVETVAIDWGYAGLGALGEEIGPTVMSPALWFQGVTPAQLPELEQIVFDGYLRGLREAGWRGDPRLPRLGYLCTVAVRFGPNITIPEALTADSGQPEMVKQFFGWTIEEWADQLREMRRFVIARAEEARRLMAE